ncbi:MAG TPA: hypothetical protein VN878_00740 [Usitatibacter sp.]|nr:hypothetical protein [Usitatibacter sp.]
MELSNAISILRALAEGVNPMTGEIFPDDSPYAEPGALRALFAAIELLEGKVEREKRQKRRPANFGKPWSDAEDEALHAQFERGVSVAEMARLLARSQPSCRLRLEKLGLAV